MGQNCLEEFVWKPYDTKLGLIEFRDGSGYPEYWIEYWISDEIR